MRKLLALCLAVCLAAVYGAGLTVQAATYDEMNYYWFWSKNGDWNSVDWSNPSNWTEGKVYTWNGINGSANDYVTNGTGTQQTTAAVTKVTGVSDETELRSAILAAFKEGKTGNAGSNYAVPTPTIIELDANITVTALDSPSDQALFEIGRSIIKITSAAGQRYTISSDGTERLFYLKSTGITVFENVILDNGGSTANNYGGGIYANDYHTLYFGTGAEVRNCTAQYGGGIAARRNTRVTLYGDAKIHNNYATRGGGGFFQDVAEEEAPHDTQNKYLAKIRDNVQIYNNQAERTGGGIQNGHWGIVDISGSVKIRDNVANRTAVDFSSPSSGWAFTSGGGDGGGGIYNAGEVIISDDAQVTGNQTSRSGGGVYNAGTSVYILVYTDWGTNYYGGTGFDTGIVRLQDRAAIAGNTAHGTNASEAGFGSGGGGVYNNGQFYAEDESEIKENLAVRFGGGVFNVSSRTDDLDKYFELSFDMQYEDNPHTEASAQADVAQAILDADDYAATQNGFFLQGDAAVKDNTAQSGGGIYNSARLLVQSDTAVVSGNTANGTNASDASDKGTGKGGGVYNSHKGYFELNGSVENNFAERNGGGVYNGGGYYDPVSGAFKQNYDPLADDLRRGEFIMESDGLVGGNTILSAGEDASDAGAGVYNDGIFEMKDEATVSGNIVTAGTGPRRGGGIYVSRYGELTMDDESVVSGNKAFDGAGIWINPAAVGGVAVKGSISGNQALNNGGGIYTDGDDTLVLAADGSAGSSLSILNNTAAGNGGGIFIVPGRLSKLTVGANVVFSGNASAIGATENHDTALHSTNVLASGFTAPYTYGYNNHDIGFDNGTVAYDTGTPAYPLSAQPPAKKRYMAGASLTAPNITQNKGGGATLSLINWTRSDGGAVAGGAAFTVPIGDLILTAVWEADTSPPPIPPAPNPPPEDSDNSDGGGSTGGGSTGGGTGGGSSGGGSTSGGGSFGGGSTGGGSTGGGSTTVTDIRNHKAYVYGYPDGTFKPDGNLTRAEASSLLFGLMGGTPQGAKAFSDLPANAWYTGFVKALADKGILNGYPDGTFKPSNFITRAEFVTMVVNFRGPGAGTSSFADVESGYWAYDAIGIAVSRGYIAGYPDGTFKPSNPITRAEAVAILNRVFERSADRGYIGREMKSIISFPDVKADFWAFYDIVEAANNHNYNLRNGAESWVSTR